MPMQWYAVQTYSGYEDRAKLALEDAIRRAGLEHKFGQVLVPKEQVVEVREGRKRETTRKIYPGYIFVEMELDDQTRHLVQETPKIAGFVGDRRNPPPIPEDQLRQILGTEEEEEEGRLRPLVEFEPGEQVLITDGPFASLEGTVQEVNAARGKLHVVVMFFARETAVELDFTQVEKKR